MSKSTLKYYKAKRYIGRGDEYIRHHTRSNIIDHVIVCQNNYVKFIRRPDHDNNIIPTINPVLYSKIEKITKEEFEKIWKKA